MGDGCVKCHLMVTDMEVDFAASPLRRMAESEHTAIQQKTHLPHPSNLSTLELGRIPPPTKTLLGSQCDQATPYMHWDPILLKFNNLSFQEVGGYSELQKKYLVAIPEKLIENSTCGLPRVDSWQLLRHADPSLSDIPWPAFLMGQLPASIWYWCTDQIRKFT
ncbi:hypothetical protein SK128_024736 [Halocaridina rubra]|uniref:Uncharacterized protein n=1 Tax=Halocaridina rubra TaxID=373956 RepID=A0AAN8ZYK4_HALRR